MLSSVPVAGPARDRYLHRCRMDLLLPDGLKALIRDRYLAGVPDAQSKYPFSAADEDALTGALGNSISMPDRMGGEDESSDSAGPATDACHSSRFSLRFPQCKSLRSV